MESIDRTEPNFHVPQSNRVFVKRRESLVAGERARGAVSEGRAQGRYRGKAQEKTQAVRTWSVPCLLRGSRFRRANKTSASKLSWPGRVYSAFSSGLHQPGNTYSGGVTAGLDPANHPLGAMTYNLRCAH